MKNKKQSEKKAQIKKSLLYFSFGLNLILLVTLFCLNERYALWGKIQRVWLEQAMVPGLRPRHELNRNYQTRQDLFRIDRNQAARILFIGDSHVALVDWTSLLGVPIVANRGIEGDTTTGLLARLGDEAQFRGDSAVIWIGTNDVLQGEQAEGIAERIVNAVRRMADDGERNAAMLKKGEKRKVFVLGVPPVARWVERAAERNSVVAEVNRQLATAAPVEDFTFIDLEPVLSDRSDYLRGDMTSDGIHLSAAAYNGIVGLIWSAMGTAPR